MAEGYARSRPSLHPLILERIRAHLSTERFDTALDVGCGAGLSTAALAPIAARCYGIDPALNMLRLAGTVAPGAVFAAARAEALPVRDRSIDLITAAGSLNYVDLPAFLAEANRVLRPRGAIAVYDFGHGREFVDSPALAEWNERFYSRYPSPPARALDPETLAHQAIDFHPVASEEFAIPLRLSPEFYLDYTLTETNVADAVREGTSLANIRAWCEPGITQAFTGAPRDVVFRGYLICLQEPGSF
jgi:SAM-dependent methyltransferase